MHTIQIYWRGKHEPYEHKTIIEALKDHGVAIIEPKDGGFDITDGCDEYYSVFLTPEQLAALGEELIAMAQNHQDAEGAK